MIKTKFEELPPGILFLTFLIKKKKKSHPGNFSKYLTN